MNHSSFLICLFIIGAWPLRFTTIFFGDWNQVAKEHPEIWTGTDQVHFGSDNSKIEAGAKLYADTIATALQTAQDKPVKSK